MAKVSKKKKVSTRTQANRRQNIQKIIDVEGATLTLIYPDGDKKEFNFQGMELEHMAYLAMHGAAAILSKRRDPDKSWGDMVRGIFHRTKAVEAYPIAVRAYARCQDISLSKASELWQSMTPAERRAMRAEKQMKLETLAIQMEKLESEA